MQLRDAQTSELLAEGTPEEIAYAAEAFEPGEVLFDGAGQVDEQGVSKFNPAAVREACEAEITGIEAEIAASEAAPNGEGTERRRMLRETVKSRRDAKATGRAAQTLARDRQQEARERVRQARRDR